MLRQVTDVVVIIKEHNKNDDDNNNNNNNNNNVLRSHILTFIAIQGSLATHVMFIVHVYIMYI